MENKMARETMGKTFFSSVPLARAFSPSPQSLVVKTARKRPAEEIASTYNVLDAPFL